MCQGFECSFHFRTSLFFSLSHSLYLPCSTKYIYNLQSVRLSASLVLTVFNSKDIIHSGSVSPFLPIIMIIRIHLFASHSIFKRVFINNKTVIGFKLLPHSSLYWARVHLIFSCNVCTHNLHPNVCTFTFLRFFYWIQIDSFVRLGYFGNNVHLKIAFFSTHFKGLINLISCCLIFEKNHHKLWTTNIFSFFILFERFLPWLSFLFGPVCFVIMNGTKNKLHSFLLCYKHLNIWT